MILHRLKLHMNRHPYVLVVLNVVQVFVSGIAIFIFGSYHWQTHDHLDFYISCFLKYFFALIVNLCSVLCGSLNRLQASFEFRLISLLFAHVSLILLFVWRVDWTDYCFCCWTDEITKESVLHKIFRAVWKRGLFGRSFGCNVHSTGW